MIAAYCIDSCRRRLASPRSGRFTTASRTPVRRAAFTVLLTLAIIVVLVAAPSAQGTQAAFLNITPGPAPSAEATGVPTDVDLLVGRSTVLNVGSTIARVSLTVPDIADAIVTAPSQLLIHGKQPGTISLFVWDRAGAIRTYEVKVRRDLTPLIAHLKQLFPAENITVIGSGKDVVVSGTVSSKYVIEKAAEIAGGYVEKKEDVVNLLQQQEGVASNQVMLRVRFAEVSRSAMQELGASFFAHAFRNDWYGRTNPGVPGPDFDSDRGLVFSDFLNLFVFNAKEGLGGVVRALQTRGLFQSLAEPNLIATNGREASFLAGGEYPFPVVQPSAGTTAITIMFKEFGIRLNFTPTVLGGDLVHLKVRPEVSSLDFANAIQLHGFRIPALSTRRTETEVELRDGQTFAIAGLLNNTLTNSMSKIPGIGDIPVLGQLFRSRGHQKNQTELVVMITPTIIKRGQMGVSEGLPSLIEPYLPPPSRTYPNPDTYTGSPRYPPTQAAPRSDASPAPGRTAQPQTAAAPAVEGPQPTSQPTPLTAAPAAEPLPSVPLTASPLEPVALPIVPEPAMPLHQSGAGAPARQENPAPAPTKEQLQALERAREDERKAAEHQRKADATAERERAEAARQTAERQKAEARAEEKRRAEVAKREDEKRRQIERLERDRAKREAEVAKKSGENARRKAEEEEKRQRALADAEGRLKAAQAAYEAEVARTKGGTQ